MTDDIRYIWIDPRGREENGAGSGVSRDIYSSFWNEVYNAYLYMVSKKECHMLGMICTNKSGVQLA